MITLSAIAKQEKNKLSTDSVFLILLDIDLVTDIVRICYNTDDIYWNGNLYQAFPFDIGDVNEDTDDSDPEVQLSVSNVSQALQYAVENAKGGNGLSVILRVVNTLNLNSNKAEIEESFVIEQTEIDENYIIFKLGAEDNARTRRPLNRCMKNNCPFKYKGLRCGYNGTLPTCTHTLVACREHDNSKRFGGFPGIDQKGVYVSG